MVQLIEEPDNIYTDIKSKLKKGVKNRHHNFHTPVFSNISRSGEINSRVVVLRLFDPLLMKINFHTDFRSKKINNIKKNPETSFLFYDYKIKIQLRISTKSSIHYNDMTTQQAWKKTVLSSRKCYLTQHAPSSNINIPSDGLPEYLKGVDPTKEESEIGYKNFVVVSSKIKKIEWLHLSSSGHRRLLISIDNNQNYYQWLIP